MNHHNHRESSYLPAYKAADIYVPIRHLYICREPSTNQLLFMQNKPNSPNVQIYINIYYIKDYQIFIPLAGQKNKPNQSQSLVKDLIALVNARMFISKTVKILVPTAENEYGLWPNAEIREILLN